MTKLRKLDISWNSGVEDQGISALNLEELDAWDNPKITTLNHMTKLRKLVISWDCGVGEAMGSQGIADLNLEELTAYDNPKITTKKLNK